MRCKFALLVVVVALSMSLSGLAISASASPAVSWKPPKDGVVRDATTAISIARLVWFSMHPGMEQSDDKTWQSGMVASLHNGVWKVQQKSLKNDSLGGGLEIDISKRDGRIIAIFLTQ